MQAILCKDEFDFRYDCGVCKMPKTLGERDSMVNSLCKHYVVVKIIPQLKQLEEGLGLFNVLQLLRSNKLKMLLIPSSQKLTSDQMLDSFEPQLSTEGNHLRDVQEGVVLLWANYIQTIQGIYPNPNECCINR